MQNALHVANETGTLKKVLVHSPGIETTNFTSDEFSSVFALRPTRTSFDYDKAIEEHRNLVKAFENNGVEVVYLKDLVIEAVEHDKQARRELTESFLSTCSVSGNELLGAVRAHLEKAASATNLVNMMLAGMRYEDVLDLPMATSSLTQTVGMGFNPRGLMVNPMNTLFFTRDPSVVVGDGVCCNHMYWSDRNHEATLHTVVFRYHPMFKDAPLWFEPESSFHIEGGDILNMDEKTVLVGMSQRTEAAAIDVLAASLLWNPQSTVDTIYVVEVEENGTRIHLDTYLNRIDPETFVVDRTIDENLHAYKIGRGRKQGTCTVVSLDCNLDQLLALIADAPSVRTISCETPGFNRTVEGAAVETLVLSPNKLCVSANNAIMNRKLARAGFDLIEISLDELTSGYGGPSCLCMPLVRDEN